MLGTFEVPGNSGTVNVETAKMLTKVMPQTVNAANI